MGMGMETTGIPTATLSLTHDYTYRRNKPPTQTLPSQTAHRLIRSAPPSFIPRQIPPGLSPWPTKNRLPLQLWRLNPDLNPFVSLSVSTAEKEYWQDLFGAGCFFGESQSYNGPARDFQRGQPQQYLIGTERWFRGAQP